jgi:hypothetical protein
MEAIWVAAETTAAGWGLLVAETAGVKRGYTALMSQWVNRWRQPNGMTSRRYMSRGIGKWWASSFREGNGPRPMH